MKKLGGKAANIVSTAKEWVEVRGGKLASPV